MLRGVRLVLEVCVPVTPPPPNLPPFPVMNAVVFTAYTGTLHCLPPSRDGSFSITNVAIAGATSGACVAQCSCRGLRLSRARGSSLFLGPLPAQPHARQLPPCVGRPRVLAATVCPQVRWQP
jgi:hypothetical protein